MVRHLVLARQPRNSGFRPPVLCSGLVVCGLVGPFAWVIGNRVIREIDASGG